MNKILFAEFYTNKDDLQPSYKRDIVTIYYDITPEEIQKMAKINLYNLGNFFHKCPNGKIELKTK